MSHLGARVTALVDGELAADAAARAHAHLLQCTECRLAVEAERTARRLLQAAADPAVPPTLTAALLTMGGPAGPLPPRPGHVPGTPRPEPLALPRLATGVVGSSVRGGRRHVRSGSAPHGREGQRTARPGSRAAPFPGGPGRRVRRRLAVAVIGSFSLASVGVLSATVLTGVLADTPSVPATSQLTVDRTGDRTGEAGAGSATRSSSPVITPSSPSQAAAPDSGSSASTPGSLGAPPPALTQNSGRLVADVSTAGVSTSAAGVGPLAHAAAPATPGPTASR